MPRNYKEHAQELFSSACSPSGRAAAEQLYYAILNRRSVTDRDPERYDEDPGRLSSDAGDRTSAILALPVAAG